MDKVFITGASGLLGRRLVKCYRQNNFFVFAHYRNDIPQDLYHIPNIEWIKGDFVNSQSLDIFFNKYKENLFQCNILINNYGPIISKEWESLADRDFLEMNFSNFMVPYKFLKELLPSKNLKSVINVGFSSCGEWKPYKKILPYAIAKNSLYLLLNQAEKRGLPANQHHLIAFLK